MTLKPAAAPTISLAGAVVVVPPKAHETARLAAGEMARYLYQLTGKPSPVTDRLPDAGAAVVVDSKLSGTLGVKAPRGKLGPQGYHLAAARQGKLAAVCLAAPEPVGLLYGVYGLLEQLGMGFYAGGDCYPGLPARAEVPADLDEAAAPVFSVRGNMLHYNFLCGPTDWGLADYQFYFDQLARMRANMLLIHWYDGEPTAAHQVNGEYLTGDITPNALTKPWGAMEALRCSQFSFGTGRFFDQEFFTAPMGEDFPDLLTEVKRSEAVFSEATRYARRYGIEIAAGFEEPRGDPTDPREVRNFQARVRQFVERNPHITRLALWQHESGGCFGTQPPARGSSAGQLYQSQHEQFAYLGTERRVWEAIRYGEFARIAAEVLRQDFNDLPLVVVGWGGDRWMRFADYCLGYDKLLPENVAFTCHENIDASFGPNVSTPWGELPAQRERWAMPWVEGDIDDCWVRQPHVESLGKLTPDALQKGCQGMMTLQWRTRDVEEETGFIARFAWDPTLTTDRFYRDLARHQFGPDQAERMGKHLGTLQRLGARWTGVRGCAECSRMQWTGWKPHIPWEVQDAPEHLIPWAKKAAVAFAEVPPPETDSEAGAFHLRGLREKTVVKRDPTRLGVAELKQATKRLEALRGETDDRRLREALRALEEDLYALRAEAVHAGMSTREYQAIDGFLIALHQLQRSSGFKRHMQVLRGIRRDLAALREEYLQAGRTEHLERLDFLAATMDFAMNFDATVVLVADGELADQALAAAAAAKDPAEASRIAGEAYGRVVEAGMQRALEAFSRKLTTRCDFGVMTTLNVKPMPLYWQTVAKLEEHMTAVPPREVRARGRADQVWVSWKPSGRAAAQHLYRSPAGQGRWKRVNREPLQAGCRMFLDRPPAGAYDYAVTAVDADGGESPRSHRGHAVCGPQAPGPRIVACKPPSFHAAGQDLEVGVVAVSDREVEEVEVLCRWEGEPEWWAIPLARTFRDAWRGTIPGGILERGVLQFYVEAVDGEGRVSAWPETGTKLPWSVTVG